MSDNVVNRGEEDLYWAGYLFADGSFTRAKIGSDGFKRKPKIDLSSKDREQIVKFCRFFGRQ